MGSEMCIRDRPVKRTRGKRGKPKGRPKGPKPPKDETEQSQQSIEPSRENNITDEAPAESDAAAPNNEAGVDGHAEPDVGLESDTATQPELENPPSPDIAMVDEDSKESASE